MTKNKIGISSIVAVVFLIGITVVAASILLFFIFDLIESNYLDIDPGTLSIASACYEVPAKELSVYIDRSVKEFDGVDFVGVEMVYSINGNSVSWVNEGVPLAGGSKGYIIPFVDEIPDTISIAPVVVKNGKERTGPITNTLGQITTAEYCSKSDLENDNFVDVEAGAGLSGAPELRVPDFDKFD
jgi:hypothetical protein